MESILLAPHDLFALSATKFHATCHFQQTSTEQFLSRICRELIVLIPSKLSAG